MHLLELSCVTHWVTLVKLHLENLFYLIFKHLQVKAVVLDPRNGFNVDRTLTKQDVQKLEEVTLIYFFLLYRLAHSSPANARFVCLKFKLHLLK